MTSRTGRRYPTWEQFKEIIDRGVPRIVAIQGTPRVVLFVLDGGDRIGLRIYHPPVDPSELPPPLEDVEILQGGKGRDTYLELSSTARLLYREFYSVLLPVAHNAQIDHVPPLDAIRETVEDLRRLLRRKPLLDEDRQLGLLGELLMLERLLAVRGLDALDAWTGPKNEPHDFRYGNNELEVKSTRNRRRIHIISSIDQLSPTPGRRLFIVSYQFGLAGADAGYSLPEVIDRVRRFLTGGRRERFDSLLSENIGYRDSDANQYKTRYQERSITRMIPVDDGCPKITGKELGRAVPVGMRSRISDVQYRVDLEGLGHEDGSRPFLKVIPEGRR